MKLRAPTAEEISALRTFARITGKRWKFCLNQCWQQEREIGEGSYVNTHDAALLRGLRNSHGPSWLARFKLPEAAQ